MISRDGILVHHFKPQTLRRRRDQRRSRPLPRIAATILFSHFAKQCIGAATMGTMKLVPATVADYRALAEARLPRQLFDYIDGGASDEVDAAANVRTSRRYGLSGVMREVSKSTTVRPSPPPRRAGGMGPVGWPALMALERVQAARAAAAPVCPLPVDRWPLLAEEVRGRTASRWFKLYMIATADTCGNCGSGSVVLRDTLISPSTWPWSALGT